jgi:ABC-type nickel/cobalt efflux system permease component RcnA
MSWPRRDSSGVLLVAAGAIALAVLVPPRAALAHPLGNFSINQYAGIRIEGDGLVLRYFLDLAEIPTFQEIQETGIVPAPDDARVQHYVRAKAEALKERLWLELNGRRLTLQAASRDVIFPPGAGGLPTMKLGILYRAALDWEPEGTLQLRYRDENFPDRAGWKEVIAVAGERITLVESSVPDRDRSRELADYPTDLLNSPPQVVEARVVFTRPAAARASAPAPSGPSVARAPSSPLAPPAVPPAKVEDRVELQPNAAATPRDAFTELVATRELGAGVIVFALVVAAVLGAFHALEPGHGKTIVAAYLVGSRGTARHAVILGLIVTASHTAGVYLLGAVTFYATNYIVPERLYPWLGGASGLTIAVLGLVLFTRRYAGIHSHAHHHHHDDPHHGDAPHTHRLGAHHHHGPEPGVRPSLRELFALGITGGIIPCPAALVVLLSALSLRRVGFGLLLIVAFSVGLALVLIAIGVLMVYARRLMASFGADGPLITRWLPLTSAAAMTLLGVTIAAQSLTATGILQIRLG